jgi:hypothetical protein
MHLYRRYVKIGSLLSGWIIDTPAELLNQTRIPSPELLDGARRPESYRDDDLPSR